MVRCINCQPSQCARRCCRLAAKQSLEDVGARAAAEWRTLAALLAQMLAAHFSSLQGAARNAAAVACDCMWTIAASADLTNGR